MSFVLRTLRHSVPIKRDRQPRHPAHSYARSTLASDLDTEGDVVPALSLALLSSLHRSFAWTEVATLSLSSTHLGPRAQA